jgi:hypothetical protein
LIEIKAAGRSGAQTAAMNAFTLPHKVILLTALKLAAFGLIYALVFAPASRTPIDTATRIAGPAAHP